MSSSETSRGPNDGEDDEDNDLVVLSIPDAARDNNILRVSLAERRTGVTHDDDEDEGNDDGDDDDDEVGNSEDDTYPKAYLNREGQALPPEPAANH